MKKEAFRRISSSLSTVLLLLLVVLTKYTLISILTVFIMSIVLTVISELLEIKFYGSSEVFKLIRERKKEKDSNRAFAAIGPLLFLPVIQTILVIIIAYIMHIL